MAYSVKDADGSSALEGKPTKRGGSSGYGSHEVRNCYTLTTLNLIIQLYCLLIYTFTKLQKQVWVQKSSSAT